MAAGKGLHCPSATASPMGVVSGEMSMDTRVEGKSINTAVSPAPIYTGSMWSRHNGSSVCIGLPHTYTHMCYNLSTHTYICK